MKLLYSHFLFGVCTAVSPAQQVLQAPQDSLAKWGKPLQNLQESLQRIPSQARSAWDEVAMLYPEALHRATSLPSPKKHRRRPDTYWDHITEGASIQSLRLDNAEKGTEKETDGGLATFNLRTKKVDPESLGVDPGVKQYSGYLDDNENDKHLFYWFFESRNDPENDPVVLWLNGGPGCSSLTGLFLELGPSSIDKNQNLVYNPYAWNSNSSVIFLDQPVNTGYSYSGGSVSDSFAAGKDVYALLSLFFEQFPQYAHQDFHIAGESYAGHYIPVMASEILSHKDTNINLKSILIGNGLTDGLTQYEYFKPMACGEGGWPAVLDKNQCQSMENALPRCQWLIQSCYDSESVWSCVPAAVYCNSALLGPYQQTGQNPYDVRIPCEDGNLCYSQLDDVSKWLNKPEVMEALGAEIDTYEGCNFDINRNFLFAGDWMKPIHQLVPDILDKIPVLIYAGDADFICNWLGNEAWVEALDWPGQKAYNKIGREDLKLGGTGRKTGEVKSNGNLTFIRLHAAGHMVPFDQPESSLDFFNRWIGGEWV